VTDAFEATRAHGGTLHDLMCTATHFVARCVGLTCRRWLPTVPRRVFVSGGGTRNGFLWKLLADQFPDSEVERLDVLGVPAGLRTAAAGAVLAGLALDGVPATLPHVTGSSGSRLVGRFVPGDRRNWAACTAWMTERLLDYVGVSRAA
jgi:anhydro-N-acetylmuramic acid kinase